MNDIDAARARHRIDPYFIACESDRQPWPCDFALAIAALDEAMDRAIRISAEADRFLRERNAARALADELGRMLSEACWAIDHTCTQCGERQPAHTPRCPTYLALAKWEASRAK